MSPYITVNDAKGATISGVIGSNVGLTKLGTGTLALTGANTYTGNTTLSQGTISTSNASALGGSSNSLMMSGTSSLSLNAGLTIGDLTGVSGTSINTSASGSNTLTISSANSATFAGVISGTGALSKGGAGTETLSGTNTYTGATTISAGTLQISGSGSLGSGNFGNNISIASGATFQYSSSINQTLSGTVSGAGVVIKDSSSSTLTFSSGNSYSGGTTIYSGTIKASSNGAFGTGAITCDTSCTPLTCTIAKNGNTISNTIINPILCTVTP
jgi:autotransporter-associated beta strand protein